MKRRYLVISNWISKATGEPQSSIAPINEGVNKQGNEYQISDTDNSVTIEGTYPVGTILQSTTTFVTNTTTSATPPATPTPAPKSTKV